MNVPTDWTVLAPSVGACTSSASRSQMIVGPMGPALSECGLPLISHGTFAVFAHDGPPAAPVLSGQPVVRATRVNGIWVTTFEGVCTIVRPAESYLLAMLDGWDNWLLFVSPGRGQASALANAKAVLDSVHVVAGQKVAPQMPVPQDFAGTWSHGPDNFLAVGQDGTGQEGIGSAAGCEPPAPLGCHISLVLKVSVSANRSFLTAKVTEVRAFEPGGRSVVDPPLIKQLLQDGALPVGTTMGFEGADHGMLVQTSAPKAGEFPVEWPYWCNFDQQTTAERSVTDYCD
ncbi:MAG TPA: hypothetical protein VK425_09115 [Acidimicrobiales bacterium]|nr:hypothetical protein [Acidimicrobiales bacterium]